MRIEIKNNQINIEFTEEETLFIKQKVGTSEVENISNYMKGKLVKALSLDALEKTAMPNVGKDFNLIKIKKVTDELKKNKSDKVPVIEDHSLKEKTTINVSSSQDELVSDEPESNESKDKREGEIAAEIGDELLADLLDKDLLKGRQKPKKGTES